jgi:hypothetical protein
MLAGAAQADHHSLELDGCEEGAFSRFGAAYLVEPWEANSFYLPEHNLRVAVLGSGPEEAVEPQSLYLMFLGQAPVFENDPGPRICRIVTFEDTLGFSAIDLAEAVHETVLSRGQEQLRLTLPVEITLPSGASRRETLSVRYQHETGNMGASLEGF